MAEPDRDRSQDSPYSTEVESRRTPAHDGEPPRPPTEPTETEGRSTPDLSKPAGKDSKREIHTDPFTGQPLD